VLNILTYALRNFNQTLNTQHSRLIDQLHAATAFLLTTD